MTYAPTVSVAPEAQPPVPVPQAGQLFPQEGVVVLNRLRGLQQQAARLGSSTAFFPS